MRKERRGKVRVEIYPVRLASALSAWLGFEGSRRTSVGIVMHMICVRCHSFALLRNRVVSIEL